MANRLNDTDPQSPRAFGSRTDPGLGEPPPLASALRADASPVPPEATPSPGATSIEELIDGITGPRPPSSRPQRPSRPRAEAAPSGEASAYAAARPAPPAQPMPPPEPAVLTPEPPLYSGAGRSQGFEVPRKVEPESAPPVVRRGDERTVHTGRRAVARNIATVAASSMAVALMMVSIMRWKEAHRLPPSESIALPTAQESAAGAQALTAPATPAVEVAPAAPVASAPSAAVAEPAPPIAKPAGTTQKKARAGARGPAASSDALDDLNRQIRH